MHKRESWRKLSVRRKTMAWLCAVVLVMVGLVLLTDASRYRTIQELDRLQKNDTLCYAVQEALEQERRTLENLIRDPTQTNRQLFHEACGATREAIDALPFDYAQIGEDRYARTWSLRSGYEGYCVFRDELMTLDPAGEEQTARYYRVMQMQEDLSVYALRLAQATLEQGSGTYRRILDSYQLLPVLNLVLVAAAFLTVLGIFRLLGRSLVRPVLEMSAQSRCIADNDFNVPDLHFGTGDEVDELAEAFNRMKHATREHIQTLEEKNRIESALHREEMAKLELEKRLDRTRLEMLKSQVNPHFLFNTLNLISCMARLEDAQNTDRMILSLSGIFRYNLRTREQEVPLEQELGALADYIYIQQTRFDGRIRFDKEVRVNPRLVRIPSFTLQPVVENAFIHGLSGCEEGGRIFLRIWQEGRMLRICVSDNGVGIAPDRLRELEHSLRDGAYTSTGIGLGNISRRIRMLYPEGELCIHSRPGRGTVIRITVPQQQEGDM